MFKNSKKGAEFITAVLTTVNKYKTQGIQYNLWNEVIEDIKKQFPHEDCTKESLRSLYRYYKSGGLGEQRVNNAKQADLKKGLLTLEDRLLERTKYKVSLLYLSQLLQVTEEEILVAYANLQAEGYTNLKLWTEGGVRFMQNLTKAVTEEGTEYDLGTLLSEETRTIIFGLMGDTHIGSEYHDSAALENFYDICAQRGIQAVFHTGDVTEGFKTNRVETFLGNTAIGFQDQVELVIKSYPYREGITTYFITGNHDLWSLQNGLAHIGRTLSMVRGDMKYLGDEFARIRLTDKITLALVHPRDGATKNVFYKAQTYIDEASTGKIATINAIGHYHKMGIIKHRDVFGIYTASFQKQSNWMKANNLKSYVGAYIITLTIDDQGNLLTILPEYVDYHNVT